MHYSHLVIIPSEGDIESLVEEAMQPTRNREWDWYQIGGRWTGVLDGYDPEKDPANTETCKLCNGTGKRPDADKFEAESPGWIEQTGGCNMCRGKGKHVKWPTDFARHDGDIVPVESLSEAVFPEKFHAVVEPDGSYHQCEDYDWYPWEESPDKRLVRREKPLPPLDWLKREYDGHRAVVVDAHN